MQRTYRVICMGVFGNHIAYLESPNLLCLFTIHLLKVKLVSEITGSAESDCTVLTATGFSQWIWANFDPLQNRNPGTDRHKILHT